MKTDKNLVNLHPFDLGKGQNPLMLQISHKLVQTKSMNKLK